MNDNEESEIMQDFGQMLRTVMGSGLQAVEQAQRRAAMRAQEQAMNEARERGVAQMIGKDFASDKFWRSVQQTYLEAPVRGSDSTDVRIG